MLDIVANLLLICIVCEVNGIKWNCYNANHQSTAEQRKGILIRSSLLTDIIIIIIIIVIIIILITINILILLL